MKDVLDRRPCNSDDTADSDDDHVESNEPKANLDKHPRSTPQEPPQRKKRIKRGIRLSSHALDNAKERLAAFHALHADVIDEYLQLKNEVRDMYVRIGALERTLSTLVRNLSNIYE